MNNRIENEHARRKKRPKLSDDCDIDRDISQDDAIKGKWEPSNEEIKEWNRRVMDIVALVESEAKKRAGLREDEPQANSCQKYVEDNADTEGRDRSGKVCHTYRESIPPFLAAAADGDLDALRKCINGTNTIRDNEELPIQSLDPKRQEHVKTLLSLRDRNGSTAEHWAAGGGHLDCVSYLLESIFFLLGTMRHQWMLALAMELLLFTWLATVDIRQR